MAVGRRVILPSKFVGSPRYMKQCYQDAMAIVCKYGQRANYSPDSHSSLQRLKHASIKIHTSSRDTKDSTISNKINDVVREILDRFSADPKKK
ncbi:hypothetical protein QTP88_000203 [Uroleucon formosanum]